MGHKAGVNAVEKYLLLLPTLEPPFRVAHHIPSLSRLVQRTQEHYENYSVLLPVRTVPTADQAMYQYFVRLLRSDSKIFTANILLITWVKFGFLTWMSLLFSNVGY
jgi:hypothetical protein